MAEFRNNRKERFGERDSDRPKRFESRGAGRPGARPSGSYSERPGRSTELQMFKVTCDKCGIECEVPFKPTSSKPIYCRACYSKPGSSEAHSRPPSSDELRQINMKLDRILKALDANEQ